MINSPIHCRRFILEIHNIRWAGASLAFGEERERERGALQLMNQQLIRLIRLTDARALDYYSSGKAAPAATSSNLIIALSLVAAETLIAMTCPRARRELVFRYTYPFDRAANFSRVRDRGMRHFLPIVDGHLEYGRGSVRFLENFAK